MATNGNGWILKTLVGFILSALLGTMVLIGNNVIANDKESRIRDEKIDHKVDVGVMQQQVVNEKTAVTLENMLVHLEYIKKQVEKIG